MGSTHHRPRTALLVLDTLLGVQEPRGGSVGLPELLWGPGPRLPHLWNKGLGEDGLRCNLLMACTEFPKIS